jgi:hypothetical protein
MAMYLNRHNPVVNYVDEVGVDLLVVNGPSLTSGASYGVVYLYFFAIQIDIYNSAGTIVGGAHGGLQMFNHGVSGVSRLSVVNWGCYDNTIGIGGSVTRSSAAREADFQTLNGTGDGKGTSHAYDWNYGEWIRFRFFLSPKQNWLASELYAGANQSAPYVGTNQQAGEIAYRCTVENLSRKNVRQLYQDVLVKTDLTSKAMANGSVWVEPIGTGGVVTNGSDPSHSWPFSPVFRMRNFTWNGARAVPQFETYYAPGVADCNITSDSSGYMQFTSGVGTTMTNPTGTVLTPPTGFWDAAPANVTPNPSLDPSARVATPRPWY